MTWCDILEIPFKLKIYIENFGVEMIKIVLYSIQEPKYYLLQVNERFSIKCQNVPISYDLLLSWLKCNRNGIFILEFMSKTNQRCQKKKKKKKKKKKIS